MPKILISAILNNYLAIALAVFNISQNGFMIDHESFKAVHLVSCIICISCICDRVKL